MLVYLIVIACGILALLYGWVTSRQVLAADAGSARMQEISAAVQEGARAYLNRQYTTIAIVGVVILLILGITLGLRVAIGFLIGAVLSGAGVGGYYWFLRATLPAGDLRPVLEAMVALSFGASLISIFARLGGGIFTKGADVGADLVGKVEARIPEDDPRNPAVIADNVGDNVGDCAGMAADLFETYAVTIVATMLLGNIFFEGALRDTMMVLPLVIGGVCIIASVIGTYFVRLGSSGNIMAALYKGLVVTGIISAALIAVVIHLQFGFGTTAKMTKGMVVTGVGLYECALVGLAVTGLIVWITEYYTSTEYRRRHDRRARRLWAGHRQCRRHCRDGRPAEGRAQDDRCAGRSRQHDEGGNQGLCHRLCRPRRTRAFRRIYRGSGSLLPRSARAIPPAGSLCRRRPLHRRSLALSLRLDGHDSGRPGRRLGRRRGAAAVQGDSRHHGGQGKARLWPRRRHADAGSDQGNDRPVPAAGARADRALLRRLVDRRSDRGVQRARRDAARHHRHRHLRRHLDDLRRRRLGQREKIHRGGPSWRQGFRRP